MEIYSKDILDVYVSTLQKSDKEVLKIQKDSYKIVSYKVKHNYNVDGFLFSYRSLLQKAIDII